MKTKHKKTKHQTPNTKQLTMKTKHQKTKHQKNQTPKKPNTKHQTTNNENETPNTKHFSTSKKVNHDFICLYQGRPWEWDGELSETACTILHQHVIQGDLTELQVSLAIFL
jgi:hypothetical protein